MQPQEKTVVFPPYEDSDPDRITYGKWFLLDPETGEMESRQVPETVDQRRARKALERQQEVDRRILIAELEKDPNSTQGIISYPDGRIQTPPGVVYDPTGE